MSKSLMGGDLSYTAFAKTNQIFMQKVKKPVNFSQGNFLSVNITRRASLFIKYRHYENTSDKISVRKVKKSVLLSQGKLLNDNSQQKPPTCRRFSYPFLIEFFSTLDITLSDCCTGLLRANMIFS